MQQLVEGRPGVEVTTSLGNIFNPLCFANAEGVINQLDTEQGANLVERARHLPHHLLPNSYAVATLPWDSFVGIDATALNAAQRSDSSEWRQFRERVCTDYLDRHPEIPRFDETRIFPSRETMAFEGNVEPALRGQRQTGIPPLDIGQWKQHEQYVATQSSDEQANIATMLQVRESNITKWQWDDPRLAQAETILYLKNPYIPDNPITNNVVVPVGAYGIEHAAALAEAAIITQTYAEENLDNLAQEVTAGNEDLLVAFTARAAEAGKATPETTMLTLHEGSLSVTQAMIALTMEKVAGYDNGTALLHDLLQSGLVERLARYSALGLLGPMILAGKYFPGAVVRTETGLGFSDEFESYLKEARAKYVADFVLTQTVGESGEHTTRLIGRICPAAGKDGGIAAIAQAQYQTIAAHELTAAHITLND